MDDQKQIQAFADEIERVVGRFASEFDLSSAAAVGVLMQQIRNIQDDAMSRASEG
jgi:hypothetical protein